MRMYLLLWASLALFYYTPTLVAGVNGADPSSRNSESSALHDVNDAEHEGSVAESVGTFLDSINIEDAIQGMLQTAKKEAEASADDDYQPDPRTATGGIINTLLVVLTILAFMGNAGFLVHVFWIKDNRLDSAYLDSLRT
jgi:hypothetical protein